MLYYTSGHKAQNHQQSKMRPPQVSSNPCGRCELQGEGGGAELFDAGRGTMKQVKPNLHTDVWLLIVTMIMPESVYAGRIPHHYQMINSLTWDAWILSTYKCASGRSYQQSESITNTQTGHARPLEESPNHDFPRCKISDQGYQSPHFL